MSGGSVFGSQWEHKINDLTQREQDVRDGVVGGGRKNRPMSNFKISCHWIRSGQKISSVSLLCKMEVDTAPLLPSSRVHLTRFPILGLIFPPFFSRFTYRPPRRTQTTATATEAAAPLTHGPQSSVPVPQCQANKSVESDNLSEALTQFKDKGSRGPPCEPLSTAPGCQVKKCQCRIKCKSFFFFFFAGWGFKRLKAFFFLCPKYIDYKTPCCVVFLQ